MPLQPIENRNVAPNTPGGGGVLASGTGAPRAGSDCTGAKPAPRTLFETWAGQISSNH